MADLQRSRARWTLTLYPEAAEAGGSFQPTLRPPRVGGGVPDVERAQEEAARRAKGKLRRYCAANRLNRLATLTYAQSCRDHQQLRQDLAEFFKGLRRELGGKPLPYAWAPEWHPGGHGLHVHVALGRYVRHSLIRDVWGRGHIHIKLIGDLPVGSGTLAEARRSGLYLAKYVAKNVGDEQVPRMHRYDVAQGFQPASLHLAGRSDEAVIGEASERMRSAPSYVWRSSQQEGWAGPPAFWCAWSD